MKFSIVTAMIVLALGLVACSENVCEVDTDCQKDHFTGRCTNNNCTYTPIPNECGNDACESSAGENSCTCPSDCGVCEGSVPDAPSLTLTCDSTNTCESDLATQELQTHTSAGLRGAGDTFTIISTYNNPFNVRRDTLDMTLYISQPNAANSNHRITTIELAAETLDRQTVILASETINKPLFGTGRDNAITHALKFDFPTSDIEDTLRTIKMTINYAYTSTTGTTQVQRTGQLINQLRNVELTYVVTGATYACPPCDDGNDGTADICDASTNYFCTHQPISGACGNFICDTGENSCTCATDCGTCERQTTYLRYACEESACRASVKDDLSVTVERIFDPRPLSGFELSNTYTYNNPFDTTTDKINLELQLQETQPDVESVTITAVRVLQGTTIIGELEQQFALTQGTPTTIPVPLDPLAEPETDTVLSLRVEYTAVRGGTAQNSQFTKTLNRAVYLSP